LEWDALLLSRILPHVRVATYGDDRHRAAFAAAGLDEPLLLRPDLEILSTARLLEHPPIAAAVAEQPHQLICFKPNARLEARAGELGATLAHAPTKVGQGLENKLALAALAAEAGVAAPSPGKVLAADSSYEEQAALRGPDLVVQSARGHAGETTWRVRSAREWDAVTGPLGRRPVRVARWIEGQAGTVGAVVDLNGAVVVTAPIVQITGLPELTPHPMGSCGNDFQWRPSPHPGTGPAELAEALGPVLARRGYRGHFGVDFVFDGTTPWLIEINPRFTASFALYASRQPQLLHAHLAALRGDRIEPVRLPPFSGGQLIARNGTDTRQPPLTGPGWQPHPSESVGPGGRTGRFVTEGVVVADDGSLAVALP
jgi:predicted ATP-grasp superfamily ATP-dependent carboligase